MRGDLRGAKKLVWTSSVADLVSFQNSWSSSRGARCSVGNFPSQWPLRQSSRGMETLKDGRVMTVVGLHTRPDLMPKVAELIFAEWTNFWKDLGYHDAESVTKWLETITGPNSLPYYGVGLVDDKIACIAGVDATEREGDTRGPWLIDVLVLPEFRSTGVFKPIVSHIMEVQKSIGTPMMWLWTKPHQTGLYESLGWQFKHLEEWITEDKGKCLNPVMTVDLTSWSKPTLTAKL